MFAPAPLDGDGTAMKTTTQRITPAARRPRPSTRLPLSCNGISLTDSKPDGPRKLSPRAALLDARSMSLRAARRRSDELTRRGNLQIERD